MTVGSVLALVTGLVAVFVVTGGEEPGPTGVADEFAAAWAGGRRAALDHLVVDRAVLEALDPVVVVSRLGATATAIEIGAVQEKGRRASAPFVATLELGAAGKVTWAGSLPLVDDEKRGWLVAWSPGALHPALAGGGTLRRSTTWAERAPILGVGDKVLIGPTDDVMVGVEPQRLTDPAGAKAALKDQLGVEPATVDAALAAPGVKPDHFVPIIEITRAEFDAARDVIYPVPGLRFPPTVGRGGPARGFARHVVGRFGEVTAERLEQLGAPYEVGDLVGLDGLEARFESQLAGRPEVRVEALDAGGKVLEVVGTLPGTPPQPLHTTLDPVLQAAADTIIGAVGGPAALVAVDAATGEVRAIASGPAGEAFNRAVSGAYPPGSTFKVVTAHALLANGTAAATPVDCPPQFVVDGRAFRNFEGGAAGSIPFSQAFAQSCNTAVIGAAAGLPDGALATAADAFGFGVDYSLGIATVGGSFPAPAGAADRAASAIGQARITASPLHMATVAAAVLDGTWRSPVLLPGNKAAAGQVTRPLAPAIADQLRALMRQVVTGGSGTAADIPGLEVIGKSGTAEYGTGDPLPTHAWFIAAAKGLGVAVIVENRPAGGRDAAPLAARFLQDIG
ncbi:MAG: penicillin-binding transpeptidase domain-containing protein [Acidimicrobiales bacterium]